jgi:hypothetical protein
MFWLVVLCPTEEGDKLKDLMIQAVFKHGRGGKALKDKTNEIQAKRVKLHKPDGPVLDIRGSGFTRIDKIQLEFEILFILERFSRICQRGTSCYLYKHRSGSIVKSLQHNNQNLYNYFSSSFSSFRRLDLLVAAPTS